MRKCTPPQNDRAIIETLKKGDEAGIHALLDSYGEILSGLIYGIVKNRELTDIVLQDSIMKVWNKIDCYSEDKAKFLTWIVNISRNTAIDMIRSKYYKQTILLASLDEIPKSKEKVVLKESFYYFDLRDKVLGLESKLGSVLDLVYFRGYTCAEASKELNIPLGTVKSRIRKGISNLRHTIID